MYLTRREWPFAVALLFAVVPFAAMSWVLVNAGDLANAEIAESDRILLIVSLLVSVAAELVAVPVGLWHFARDRAVRTFLNGFALLSGASILAIPVAARGTLWVVFGDHAF